MFRQLTPVTKAIIVINVIMFILTYLYSPLEDFLSAYFPYSHNFKFWQIITHMFMHGSLMHLLFNMFTLFSFGPVLEKVLGSQKFTSFYFICGLGSFVIYNIWYYFQVESAMQTLIDSGINPASIFQKASGFVIDYDYAATLNPDSQKLYALLSGKMLGASGAIFGVVTAFALLFPNAELIFMFIPFPVKAKYLLPVIIIGSLFLGIRQFDGDNIAHFAHLGGALVGFIWIKIWKKNNMDKYRI